VDALATFASSPIGAFYGRVCEHYGMDPGAPLMDEDDVLAFNLRAALLALRPEAEEAGERLSDKQLLDQLAELERKI
jgi:hypothetical protein